MSGKAIEHFIGWLNTLNPTRSYLLDQFRLDRRMVRASGHWIWDDSGTRYLDFLSQYGVASFGHAHPGLQQVVRDVLDEQLPVFGQPMSPVAAQALADRLRDITPGDLAHTVFANSGAEAVEAAIKLARARTGRHVILSTTNGFHGKTLGALSATHKIEYQKPFGAPVDGFEVVPFGDLDALDARLRQAPAVAAFLVEPIQGEGGVIVPPDGYLAAARALCHQHDALFMVDEIQTGLGRTGSLFALPTEAGAPDVLVLAKALGGGLLPIGACIATPRAWDHEFGYRHSSTFAGNNLACRVALAVLDLLEADDGALIRTVAARGQELMGRLEDVATRYPGVVRAVRGRGLLVGVELETPDPNASSTMSILDHSDYLIASLCGYLLNAHQMITAPAFNNARVLRLEPPFTIGSAEIDQAVGAVESLVAAIHRHDYAEVFAYLSGHASAPPPSPRRRFAPANTPNPGPPPGTRHVGRFAFLMHYTCDRDILINDPSFEQWSGEQLAGWKHFIESSEAAVAYELPHLESAAGVSVDGVLIGLPMLPDAMMRRGRRKMLPILRDAVTRARKQGASVLGLGGFTSITTRGGELLTGQGMPITSGSSLTALTVRDGVLDLLRRLDAAPADLRLAVVGAAGAIGRLTALLLARQFGRVTLIGRGSSLESEARLHAVAGEIYRTLAAGDPLTSPWPHLPAWALATDDDEQRSRSIERACREAGSAPPIEISIEAPAVLPDADVVVCATSASAAIIEAEHLKPGAVVIDAARPPNVSATATARPDVLVVDGGLVEFPQPIHFGPNVLGFRPGVNLACLAETVVLALEGETADHSIGQTISLAEVAWIEEAAERHGFTVAPPHANAMEIPPDRLDAFRDATRGLRPTNVTVR